MRHFFVAMLSMLLVLCLALGALLLTDTVTPEALRQLIPIDKLSALQSAFDETTQLIIEGGARLQSGFSDHKPPTGSGALLEGDLPDDPLQGVEARYNFEAVYYPYRAMLTADEQSVYDQAYANAVALSEQFPLYTPIDTEAVTRVMSALYYDHPELFWINTAYQYSYTSEGTVVTLTLAYNETAADIEIHRARYDAVVAQVVAEASKLSTAVEQEKYVHDYLLDNVAYRTDAPLNQSAYSALIYGETVCAGYTRAFQHILTELGIPCYYCVGYAGESHAWNIVYLDGDYYHVDVAWDDPLGNSSGQRYYQYFNLTDEAIAEDHTRTDLAVALPACSGTRYSYGNAFAEEAAANHGGQLSSLPSPEEAGFRRDEAITALDDYYDHCVWAIAAYGEGTHTHSLLIEGGHLLETIFSLTDSGDAMEAYMPRVVAELGLSGFEASVSLQATALADDYYQLTQQVFLSGYVAQQQAIFDEWDRPETPSLYDRWDHDFDGEDDFDDRAAPGGDRRGGPDGMRDRW